MNILSTKNWIEICIVFYGSDFTFTEIITSFKMWTLLIILILAACTFSAKSFTITSTRHMFSYRSSILKFLISFATVVSIQICKRVLWSTGGCIGGSWRCSDSSRSSCCDVSCGRRSRWTYLRKKNKITNEVAIKTVSKWMSLYKWPLYDLVWPFFCHLSQNWGSDGNFEVLNRSKSWLGQKLWPQM